MLVDVDVGVRCGRACWQKKHAHCDELRASLGIEFMVQMVEMVRLASEESLRGPWSCLVVFRGMKVDR